MRLSAPSPTIVLPIGAGPEELARGPDLHLGKHDRIEEISDEECGHRGNDDPPARAEHALVGRLPGPARGHREMDDGPFHQCHEGQCSKARPDRPPGAGIAVHLGQDVIDDVGNRKEQNARAKRPQPYTGQVEDRALFRTNDIGEQQHDDERHHHEIEITEAGAVHRARLDVPQSLPLGFHAARRSAVPLRVNCGYSMCVRARSSVGQSTSLLSLGSQVRILPGAPA